MGGAEDPRGLPPVAVVNAERFVFAVENGRLLPATLDVIQTDIYTQRRNYMYANTQVSKVF